VRAFRELDRRACGLWLLIALIHLVLLRNALIHDPRIGYDAHHHLRNVQIYAELRSPLEQESAQFFSAPLPYLLPAALKWSGLGLYHSVRIAFVLQVALSLTMFIYLLRLIQILYPDQYLPRYLAVSLVGILPVYYKSFAFLRGEPYVACFTIVTLYQLFLLLRGKNGSSPLKLGACVALLALSRQWGVFAALGFALVGISFVVREKSFRQHFRPLAIAVLVSVIGAGWFYLGLLVRNSTVGAFNRAPASTFSLSNQPASFYFGLGGRELFSQPLRPNFQNELLPIFLSEMWGDYWCYFNVYGRSTKYRSQFIPAKRLALDQTLPASIESNRTEILSLLGKSNLYSLGVSGLLLFTFVYSFWLLRPIRRTSGLETDQFQDRILLQRLAAGALTVSVLGYFWFLIAHPEHTKGDTIKATYLLHAFPLLALLASSLLTRVLSRKPWLSWAVFIYLALLAATISPLYLSAYTWHPLR